MMTLAIARRKSDALFESSSMLLRRHRQVEVLSIHELLVVWNNSVGVTPLGLATARELDEVFAFGRD